jgi:hypothetical protein
MNTVMKRIRHQKRVGFVLPVARHTRVSVGGSLSIGWLKHFPVVR